MDSDKSSSSGVPTHPVIEKARTLINECESLTSQLVDGGRQLTPLPIPVINAIRTWLAKMHDNFVSNSFESLQNRIQEMEGLLRDFLDDLTKQKRAHRIQGRHLLTRLESCLDYNIEASSNLEIPMSELRDSVNELSVESAEIKAMVEFNNELLRQRNFQSAMKEARIVNPWARTTLASLSLTETELEADDHHPFLWDKLCDIRKIKENLLEILSASLVQKELHNSHIEACSNCKGKVSCAMTSETNLSSSEHDDNVTTTAFDHDNCTDCALTRDIAYECIDNLFGVQKLIDEATQSLRKLVEAREVLIDLAQRFELSDGSTIDEKLSQSAGNNSQATMQNSDRTNDRSRSGSGANSNTNKSTSVDSPNQTSMKSFGNNNGSVHSNLNGQSLSIANSSSNGSLSVGNTSSSLQSFSQTHSSPLQTQLHSKTSNSPEVDMNAIIEPINDSMLRGSTDVRDDSSASSMCVEFGDVPGTTMPMMMMDDKDDSSSVSSIGCPEEGQGHDGSVAQSVLNGHGHSTDYIELLGQLSNELATGQKGDNTLPLGNDVGTEPTSDFVEDTMSVPTTYTQEEMAGEPVTSHIRMDGDAGAFNQKSNSNSPNAYVNGTLS